MVLGLALYLVRDNRCSGRLQSLCDDTFNQLETTTTAAFVKFDEMMHQHMKAV